MMDLLMLLLLAAAFAGAIGYAGVCDRLIRPAPSGSGNSK